MGLVIYVIGVSGCGKSTIGKLLSEKTTIPFFDGDDFHPQANIDKMSSGIALVDNDRKQWLIDLNQHAFDHSRLKGAVIACSALKESYREILRSNIESQVKWVFLDGSQELIQSRMASREDHFMPVNLIQSQFETLEVPNYGVHIDIVHSAEVIVNNIIKTLRI